VLLSFLFKPVERDRDVKIDLVGAVLAASAIILISIVLTTSRPGAC